MSFPNLPSAIYVDTSDGLATLIDELKSQSLIAIDTESNSLHAYQGRVCLIQLSTRQQDYIIDPLAIHDLSPLGDILCHPNIEKIFHAAEYDLICLKRDFNFELVNVFDTMFAARILRYDAFGLADLLRTHFDIAVDKSHQLDDWGMRPLPSDSLIYAQMDTHYLPELRDILLERLQSGGHVEEAREIFADVTHIQVKPQEFDPDGFWKIGQPRSLKRRQFAVLRELYVLRDEIAQAEDVPPYRIIGNKAMVRLAIEQPQNWRDLESIRGIGSRTFRLYGHEMLDAIQAGMTAKVPQPPHNPRPDPTIAERYMILHAWRKERAIERGVDSNIVISKQALWEIARIAPRSLDDLTPIEGIGIWRKQTYGDDILEVVRTFKK